MIARWWFESWFEWFEWCVRILKLKLKNRPLSNEIIAAYPKFEGPGSTIRNSRFESRIEWNQQIKRDRHTKQNWTSTFCSSCLPFLLQSISPGSDDETGRTWYPDSVEMQIEFKITAQGNWFRFPRPWIGALEPNWAKKGHIFDKSTKML